MSGRPRRSTDLPLGVITLVIAVAYYVMAAAIPTSLLADTVGPQGLPKAYAAALAGLSLVLIARAWAARYRTQPWSSTADHGASVADGAGGDAGAAAGAGLRAVGHAAGRAAGMLLLGVAYLALVPYAGYIVTLAALIVATTYYQGGRIDRRIATVGVSGALFLWVLFVVLLGIPQPPGVWPSIF